ncbi:MAG: hypothetical protein DHS20C13_27330 [Thermodesulfobacteriota bacterium]|nr:MAG: hypothetical protein DHS20C13_27330 [Thermodesulfobacteriota bacterium]
MTRHARELGESLRLGLGCGSVLFGELSDFRFKADADLLISNLNKAIQRSGGLTRHNTWIVDGGSDATNKTVIAFAADCVERNEEVHSITIKR